MPASRFPFGLISIAVAALLLALGTCLPVPAYAAERAWITADGVLSYAGDDWVATGGVRLVQGDVEVRAERLRYDVDRDLVYFEGNVVMIQGGDRVNAAALTYDLATASGVLEEAKVSYLVEGAADPVYLLGRQIEFSRGSAVVYDGRLTTCLPPESPGYYLQSRRIDIYPGERIVVRNVRFVESGITLFYWPYVSISLREDRKSQLELPEIGHNSEDGWYVRFTFGYDGPGDGYGEAVLDVSQFRGIGTGVRHTYRDRPGSTGSFTAYRLANRQTGHDDLAFSLKESFPVSDRLRASLEAGYLTEAGEDGGEDRKAQLSAGLEHQTPGTSTRLGWTGSAEWGSAEKVASRGELDHTGRSGSLSWRLELDTFAERIGSDWIKDTQAYRAGGTYRSGPYTLQLDVERRAHSALLTAGETATPAWTYIERMPEATLTLDLQRLVSSGFPVEAAVGYGSFAEARRAGGAYERVAAQRSTAALRLKPATLSLGGWGSLNYRAGAEQRTYSTGERRWILSADHQYRLSLGRHWSLLGIYSYRQAFGDPSPFRYVDTVSEQERITARLQYLTARAGLSLSSGYDFMNGRPLDVVGNLSYRAGDRAAVNLQGAYSLVDQRPTYAAGSVTLRPAPGWTVTGAARYDMVRQEFDRIQGSVSVHLAGWRLDYSAIYNHIAGQIAAGEASLVRDLGCRQVGLRYDPVDEAVWLEYRITALPWSGVRIGASRDRMLFGADAFSDLLE